MSIKTFLLFAMTLLCVGTTAQVISSERTVNWSLAGLEPGLVWSTETRNIINYGGVGDGITSNNAAVKAAIASLNGQPGIVYFPAGTYLFTSTIALTSGIVLKGESAPTTQLKFNMSGATTDCITISGTQTGVYYPLASTGLTKDSYLIAASGNNALSEGDFVMIKQDDNGSYMMSDWAKNYVAQINKIKAINGQQITLEYPLRRTFDVSLNPRIQKLNMIRQSGIECLNITRTDVTTSQTTHVSISYAANCKIKNCWLEMSNFALVDIGQSTSIEISGNYFYNAFNWGDGGRAYGVAIQYASGQVLVENNIFRLLRHSVLLQAGANGNVVAYNYSRESRKTTIINLISEDIVCHGNYPYANLIEGNIAGSIKLDDSHGTNGKYNTIFRNRTQNSLGISITNSLSHSQNIVGNQITSNGAYSFSSSDNFLYGNNRNGTLTPANTSVLADKSYYLTEQPLFWNISDSWYGIGYPSAATNTSIPALTRYNNYINNGASPVLSCADDILPIKLTYFKGTIQPNGNIDLQWNIENIAELQKTVLQRSIDGIQFTDIATQQNPHAISSYYTDEKAHTIANNLHKIYYRILLQEKNGNSSYGNVLSFSIGSSSSIIKLWPNPASNAIHIYVNEINQIRTGAKIFNSEGKLVKQFVLTSTLTVVDINRLPAGVYLVKFADGSMRKFVK